MARFFLGPRYVILQANYASEDESIMQSLVLELQREAMSQRSRLTDVLRKTVVVATKLKVEELKIWAEYELKGYSNDQEIP